MADAKPPEQPKVELPLPARAETAVQQKEAVKEAPQKNPEITEMSPNALQKNEEIIVKLGEQKTKTTQGKFEELRNLTVG